MAVIKRFIPDHYYTSIYTIDYQMLKEQGIKALFFDLDNTLIAYDEVELSSNTVDFLNALRHDFKIIMISNSGYHRVVRAALKYPFVWHAFKPFKKGLNKALKISNVEKEQIALIGDQMMTDIFGGNRFGIHTILVQPIKRSSDRWMTKMNRMIEHYFVKRIKKKYPSLYDERIKKYVDETL